MSGPVPGGAVPEASEDARRRLYAPGGATPGAVAAYERLTAPAATPSAGPLANDVVQARPTRRGRSSRRLIRIAFVTALVVAVGVVLVVTTRAPIVEQLPPPPLGGQSIAAYGRVLDPATGPRSVTYQPEGYTVFQPEGRVVHLAFRCVGEGVVLLSAGASHRFRCTNRETSWVRSDGRHRVAPFMVIAATTGDVVWGARVVLRDR